MAISSLPVAPLTLVLTLLPNGGERKTKASRFVNGFFGLFYWTIAKGNESQEAGLEGGKMLLRFISNTFYVTFVSGAESPSSLLMNASIRPDVESGLATKEGGAVTHFRCLQEGILFNAVLHDAPSFVLLINCDSCSPRGGRKDSLQHQDHHLPESFWHLCLKCHFPDMLSGSWPSLLLQGV